MKRLIFAFIILAVLVAVGVGAKVYFGGGFSLPTSTSSPIATSNGFQYATPTAVTVPPIGAYNLESIDLGDGPVPLVTVPLDTWGGYAALFSANKGIDPNKASLFYQYGHFAVKLVNIEDSTAQLKGYAGGQYPIIWAQMDSLPLLVDAFKVDKRVIPRVLGLFDWSNGGDGIVAKSVINSPADLKGKTILTSSNTPYAFMLLWYLAQYGMTGNDVKVVWVDDGDKALELFKNSPEIVAWVTWSPYLQDVLNSKSNHFVPNTRLLINSRDASQLIADLYLIRNDLLQEHPEIAVGFAEAMYAGSQNIDSNTYNAMAQFYKVSASDAQVMVRDVHIANFPENKMFFDSNNDVGGSKIFTLAQSYYKQLGSLGNVNYDVTPLLTTKILTAVDKTGMFANQTNTLTAPQNFDTSDLLGARVVLTNNVQLYFDPEQTSFNVNAGTADVLNNLKRLAGVSDQTKFLATTVIKLTGYIYTSNAKIAEAKAKGVNEFTKAQTDAVLFSKKRADFIKQILVSRYGISPDRIVTEGGGWDSPIDDTNPNSNRRVEVAFISAQI